MRVVAASALSLAVSALRLSGAGREEARETVARTASDWLGEPQSPLMEAAYLKARDNTMPQLLNDDDTDYTWYKDLYSHDEDNPLEELSLSSNATSPTKEQRAADAKKERDAFRQVSPRLEAEEMEADYFWHEIFPFDGDNDLEEYSYLPSNTTNTSNTTDAAFE
eukprot:CAMPEP_0204565144 /NCGR_PEP_ID=MMETSP0661-20131031/35297_1 /ASSEMBLY_ACC=CAM_ASM_000606 /TAXON_ID=109239 /ORGANISM="Alexandrium margalefi, Strain AMGDE01CS-322" /LENGTH=164 /DNA_ID=CAMNT_0051572863 /DNA_START=67 /DNA_END=561 /DNA_ORIENTATION=+